MCLQRALTLMVDSRVLPLHLKASSRGLNLHRCPELWCQTHDDSVTMSKSTDHDKLRQ